MKNYRPISRLGKRIASPEYRAWQAMKNRCLNPKGQDYKFYGGRGIKVCSSWKNFDSFLADMGDRPSSLHTLERKNVDGHYNRKNCYWATRQEQARNRRFIKRYRGKTTWEWAQQLGIAHMSFHHRLWRYKTGQLSEKGLYKPR